MKYLDLIGGGQMPAVGLGTWKSTPGEVGAAVLEALRIGYRHIDCAWIYGNEAEIGAAFREAFESGLVTRDELFVTSKLWNNAHEPECVHPALEDTLQKLGLDHLDLYLMHWPVALRREATIPEGPQDFLSLDDVPLATTWEAMGAAQSEGLTRHIGVSNFSVERLQELRAVSGVVPAANQVEMHPHLPQDDLLDYCQQNGIAVTAYSPLGSPDRPPQMKQDVEPPLLDHPTVVAIAQKHAVSPAQVLVAWAVERGTSVIPKSVHAGRLAQNLAAADLELGPDDMAELAMVAGPFRYISGSFWAMEGSPYTLDWLWGDATSI